MVWVFIGVEKKDIYLSAVPKFAKNSYSSKLVKTVADFFSQWTGGKMKIRLEKPAVNISKLTGSKNEKARRRALHEKLRIDLYFVYRKQ